MTHLKAFGAESESDSPSSESGSVQQEAPRLSSENDLSVMCLSLVPGGWWWDPEKVEPNTGHLKCTNCHCSVAIN